MTPRSTGKKKIKKESYEEIIFIALCVLLPCFTFFIYAPLQFYFSNRNEFWFDMFTIIGPILVCLIVPAMILFAFGLFLRKKKHKIIFGALFFGIGVALFVQGDYINLNLGVLNGAQIIWSAYHDKFMLNALVWGAIIISSVIIAIKVGPKYMKPVCIAVIVILFLQFVTLSVLGITGEKKNNSSRYVLTTNNMFSLSEKDNVVVFLLDMFDSRYLDELIMQEDAVLADYDNFTYYRNHTGSYSTTKYSLGSLFINDYVDNSYPTFKEALNAQYNGQNNLFPDLVKNGCSLDIYCPITQLVPDELYAESSATHLERYTINNLLGFVTELYKLCATKFAPDFIKPYVWMDSSTFNTFKNVSGENEAYTTSNIGVYQLFQNKQIVKDEAQHFKFFYVIGAHYPYVNDENFNPVENESEFSHEGAIGAAKSALKICTQYIDMMKEAGVYDNTTIIIMADHGFYWDGVLTNPLFMIKPQYCQTPFTISDAPTSHINFQGTVASAMGYDDNGKYGTSVFGLSQADNTDRLFYQYYLNEGDDNGKYRLIEYRIAPEGNERKMFTLTGWEIGSDGTEIIHQEYCEYCQINGMSSQDLPNDARIVHEVSAEKLEQKDISVKKVDFKDYEHLERAFSFTNPIDIVDADTGESIHCSGWAFVATEDNNENKKGALILKGRKNAYITSGLLFRESSIQKEMPGWKKIQGKNNNYAITFSTDSLPDDIYEIYVYVEENEKTKGIADTGYGFRKKGEIVEPYTDVSLCDVPNIEEMEPSFDHGWWDIYQEDTHVRIQGWQIKEGIKSEEFAYYAAFVGDNGKVLAFRMPSLNYTVLGTDYGTDYIASGFNGCIDYEQLPDATGVRYVLAERDGVWYRTLASSYEIPVELVESVEKELNTLDHITQILEIPLNSLMQFCYNLMGDYILAIVVFTLLTKVILLPVTLWMHRNGIKMVELMPDLNELKIKYFGDKETIAEETQVLYKQKGYKPLLSTLPMIIQIVLLMGVVEAVKALIGDSDSWLLLIPSEVGGMALLMPVAAGFAALLLSLAQCKIAPLQKEQPKGEKISTSMVSVCISLFLGAFVSLGTGVYWIASNLLSIPVQIVCNILINPKKYVDYARLEDSRKKLGEMEGLEKKKEGYFSENRRRERADYKRFFSINNKHLVFYSEASGFYKYFKNTIEYLLAHSNIIIHYVTNDPSDQIFKIAEKEPRIRAYYIGKQRCITLFMKMEADIVVMTTPDLDNFYLKRSYISKDIEYIYTPHAVGSTNMTTRRGAYDHFDTFFCVGQHHVDELRETEQMYQLKPKNLVPCGYGVLDQLIESYNLQKHEKRERPRILIAPSWQEDNILDSCIDAILTELLKQDYQVIVRPHPEYVKRFGPRMDALIARYQSSIGEKLSFETDFSSNFNVFASDLLITDWSGIGYEFSLCTKRPTLFVNTKMKIFNPDYDKYSKPAMDITCRDEIGVSVDPNEMENINAIVHDMLQFRERYTEKIDDYVNNNIFSVGRYGEASAKYILGRLIEKKKSRQK